MKHCFIFVCVALVLVSCTKPHSSISSRSPHAVEYNHAAVKLMKQGDFDGAKKYIDMALVLDSEYYGAYVNLLNFHVFKKDFPAAIMVCERLLELAPETPELYVTHAILSEVTGAADQAAGWYEKGLARYDERIKEKSSEGALSNRAFIYRLMGREAEARAELERLVKEYPENGNLPKLLVMTKDEYVKSFLEVK